MSVPGALLLTITLGTMVGLAAHIAFRDGHGAIPKAFAGSAGSVLAGLVLPMMGGPFSQSFLAGTLTSVLGGLSGVLLLRKILR